ncbi:hypothetical protein ABBQ32_008504 [Trebouxia sp. C0010 RCD-2024]
MKTQGLKRAYSVQPGHTKRCTLHGSFQLVKDEIHFHRHQHPSLYLGSQCIQIVARAIHSSGQIYWACVKYAIRKASSASCVALVTHDSKLESGIQVRVFTT